jgi:hypothetical protein
VVLLAVFVCVFIRIAYRPSGISIFMFFESENVGNISGMSV